MNRHGYPSTPASALYWAARKVLNDIEAPRPSHRYLAELWQVQCSGLYRYSKGKNNVTGATTTKWLKRWEAAGFPPLVVIQTSTGCWAGRLDSLAQGPIGRGADISEDDEAETMDGPVVQDSNGLMGDVELTASGPETQPFEVDQVEGHPPRSG